MKMKEEVRSLSHPTKDRLWFESIISYDQSVNV